MRTLTEKILYLIGQLDKRIYNLEFQFRKLERTIPKPMIFDTDDAKQMKKFEKAYKKYQKWRKK